MHQNIIKKFIIWQICKKLYKTIKNLFIWLVFLFVFTFNLGLLGFLKKLLCLVCRFVTWDIISAFAFKKTNPAPALYGSLTDAQLVFISRHDSPCLCIIWSLALCQVYIRCELTINNSQFSTCLTEVTVLSKQSNPCVGCNTSPRCQNGAYTMVSFYEADLKTLLRLFMFLHTS